MSKATVTVELTADENRLLQAFRKATIADEEFRRSLNKTGDEAEKSSKRVSAAMISAGKKLNDESKKHEKVSKGTFDRIAKSAIGSIGSIATAYFGIEQAVSAVSKSIQEQQDYLEKTARKQKDIAAAQQEAAKNLSAFSRADQQSLLTQLVPQVSESAAFSDLANLTKAIGDAASAGGSVSQIRSALPIAAGLTRQTPEMVDEVTAAMMDAMRATGVQDAKLAVGQQILTGTRSRVIDPTKLVRNLSPVQVAAAESLPEGATQADRKRAALEASALFAAFTKAGADSQGDASQTALIQFMAQLRSFLKNVGKDAEEAKIELAELQKKDPISASQRLRLNTLSDNEANANRTKDRIVRVNSRLAELQAEEDKGGMGTERRRQINIEQRKLRSELSDLRQIEFTDRDAAELADLRASTGSADLAYQKKVSELQGKIAAANVKGFKGRVPMFLFEQLGLLHKNPELQKAFGNISFGEQRFRAAGESSVTGRTTFRDAVATMGLYQAKGSDTSMVDSLLDTSNFLTPQLEQAYIQDKAAAAEARQLTFDTYSASSGGTRQETSAALRDSRSRGMVAALMQSISEIGVSSGYTLGGLPGPEEGVSAIGRLSSRQTDLQMFGDADIERQKVLRLKGQIQAELRRLDSGETSRESRGRLQSLLTDVQRVTDPSIEQFLDPSTRQTYTTIEQILEKSLRVQEQMLRESKNGNNSRPTDPMRSRVNGARQ